MAVELFLGAALGQVPGACGLGVLQGFQGPEGLGGNDEQGGLGVQAAGQFMELATVDVRQVVAAHAFLGERQQGFGYQLRAEEGAADADVHHVGDRLFGIAAPQAVVHVAYQLGHLVQDAVDFRHHVDAIDQHFVADRSTQRGMQYRPALGGIDRLAVEHRPDRVAQPCFLGQLHQQVDGVLANQVLREVEEQSTGAEGKPLEALRIVDERLAHPEVLQFLAMGGQGAPTVELRGIQRSEVVLHG